jgi:hypothetical protein
MIMSRKITTAVMTALVLASSAAVGALALTSATPALARAHHQHQSSPTGAYGAGGSDHARDRSSNDIPFAPF